MAYSSGLRSLRGGHLASERSRKALFPFHIKAHASPASWSALIRDGS